MAAIDKSSKARAVTCLLKRINQGDDPILLCQQANQLIKKVEPKDIVAAEQNLIHDGYSAGTARQLSAMFMLMGANQETPDKNFDQLPDNHILRRITVEHSMIRCLIADLNDIVEGIQSLNQISDVSLEFRRLAGIIRQLSSMDEHIAREDDVIFPYLEKHNLAGLCHTAKNEHIAITNDINNLVGLILSFNNIRYDDFVNWLVNITLRLSPVILEHIRYEDQILFPIAFGVIRDISLWEKMKAVCDEVGYCCAGH